MEVYPSENNLVIFNENNFCANAEWAKYPLVNTSSPSSTQILSSEAHFLDME